MKRRLATIVFVFVALSVYGQSNRPIPLDRAIEEAAKDMDARITARSKVALINFNSPSVPFSDYVIDELTANLVNSGHLIVVDRKEIDLIRGELNFQYSGEVDDKSMQELGRMLGAQSIASGSLTNIGGVYRIVIRVLNVQTAAVEVQYRTNIVNDSKVKALLDETLKPSKKPVTTGQKIGDGTLNILLGLGSYIEGDVAGGITLTAGYAVAAGLMVIEAVALDWDSPVVGVPATIGFGVAGVTLVYGFVRPFVYNRSPQLAAIMDNTRPGIVLTADKSGGNHNAGFQLTYTFKF
jgi:TolB-like protein